MARAFTRGCARILARAFGNSIHQPQDSAAIIEQLECRCLLSAGPAGALLSTTHLDLKETQPLAAKAAPKKVLSLTSLARLRALTADGRTPFRAAPIAIPGAIRLAQFDRGGEGVAYHDPTPGNQLGAYRDEGIDVGKCKDVGGGYYVGKTGQREWLDYTVNVRQTGLYDVGFRVASLGIGGKFHITIDGVKQGGMLTVPSTGGWQKWATMTRPDLYLSAGYHVLGIVMDKPGPRGTVGNFNWMTFSSKAGATTTTDSPPSVQPAPATTNWSGNIVITHGGVYSGNWQSLNPNVPAVSIQTSDPVVIENSMIRSAGTLINATGVDANITVRNTAGYALNPNVRGRYPGRFLNAEEFSNIDIENNYLEGTSGIYLYDYQGNHTAGQTIKVLRNSAKNIDGRFSNGNGGFMTGPDDNYYVQFVQFNAVHDLAGVEIAWNQVINEPGNSRVEDNVSIFDSSGTSSSPILIHDNYIQGAYPVNPAANSDYTGGGIMLGDGGSAWVRAYQNQVISTTNYGIAIASGHDNSFYSNRIISSGLLPNGQVNPNQNVGAYIWNSDGSKFLRNTGLGNLVGWTNSGSRNDWWTPNAATWTGNSSWPGTISLITEAGEFAYWQAKLSSAAIQIGKLT